MKRFWLSWYNRNSFTLVWPWWVSGHQGDASIVCAAIQARDERAARDVIEQAMDNPEQQIEWRFCNERAAGWSPFCERFPRADWMMWPEA